MKLQVIKQTLITEATKELNGFVYNVNYTMVDDALSSIMIRIAKNIPEQGMVECGSMSRDEVNTYINIASGEDVFLHSNTMSDICKEVEEMSKKSKKAQ